MFNKEEITAIIETSVLTSPYNNFSSMNFPDEPMWQKPLIGFASGDDHYFKKFKEDIGDFYWLPNEAYKLKFSNSLATDDKLTVISIGFPQTDNTKNDQKKSKDIPSERWLRSRGEWEPMIDKIVANIIAELAKDGIEAVAIDEIKEFSRHNSEKFGLASNWSHRHTAFVAGIGTFGLSDGLITQKGKAMRFTSLIVNRVFEPTSRPYKSHQEYCKFYRDGGCGACIYRCPVQAITKQGHDKDICSAYLQKIKNEIGPDYLKHSNYISGCGLCQTKVPCQDGVPE
jgi:epoxyqueuosine reductase